VVEFPFFDKKLQLHTYRVPNLNAGHCNCTLGFAEAVKRPSVFNLGFRGLATSSAEAVSVFRRTLSSSE
jgi:hypothetical protein